MNIFKSVFKILILIIFIGTAEFSCFKSKYPEIASFLLSAGILRELRDGSGTELMREWDGTGLDPCGSGTEWESKFFKIWGFNSHAINELNINEYLSHKQIIGFKNGPNHAITHC